MQNDFIKVAGWMFKDLQLSGNEALVYALIFNFVLEHNCYYCETYSNIAKKLNIDTITVIRIINRLLKKGLIEKYQEKINDITVNFYKPLKN